MTHDELVERVAKAIKGNSRFLASWYEDDARTAINVVLEEAAKVAQDIPCGCAANIRAMKEKQ